MTGGSFSPFSSNWFHATFPPEPMTSGGAGRHEGKNRKSRGARGKRDFTLSRLTTCDLRLMAAQEMFLYGSADWKKLKSAARRAAHVDGWQEDPIYGKLLNPREQVKMPAVDESYRSIPVTAKRK